MMKKLAIAAAMFAVAANAQAAGNSVDANVTVIKPVAVASTQALGFGVLVRSATADSVFTVSNAGVLSADAGNAADSGIHSTSAPQKGIFTVTGEPNYSVDLTLDSTNGGLTGITLSAPTMDAAAVDADLGAAGSLAVNVGATITLGTTAASGAQTAGTIDLVANY